MARTQVLIKSPTSRLRPGDIVVTFDGRGKIDSRTELVKRLDSIGCTGSHWRTKSSQSVCYSNGIDVSVLRDA